MSSARGHHIDDCLFHKDLKNCCVRISLNSFKLLSKKSVNTLELYLLSALSFLSIKAAKQKFNKFSSYTCSFLTIYSSVTVFLVFSFEKIVERPNLLTLRNEFFVLQVGRHISNVLEIVLFHRKTFTPSTCEE